jgi:hypothetical protein
MTSLAPISGFALALPKSSLGAPAVGTATLPFQGCFDGSSDASSVLPDANVEDSCTSTKVLGQYTY